MRIKIHSASPASHSRIIRNTTKDIFLTNTDPSYRILDRSKKQIRKKSQSIPKYTTSIIIQKMRDCEEALRHEVQLEHERYLAEKIAYQKLIKYYEDQNKIYQIRRDMMIENTNGYKSLVGTMQDVIMTLRGRLYRFHNGWGGNRDDTDDDENDEGFYDREE